MKYICLILSIYVFAIALMPCNDVDDCNISSLATETSQNNSQQQSHEEQPCSPFCSCSCCSCVGFIITLPFAFTNTFYYNAEKAIPLFTSAFSKDFITTIWQPPKKSC